MARPQTVVNNPPVPDCGTAQAAPAAEPTEAVRQLRELPQFERREALESLVVREFKARLLMTEDDELPLDGSFFDLGLTSLLVTEVKQRLEAVLGRSIDANVIFNRPTVSQLMTHLTDDVLTELFSGGAGARWGGADAADGRAVAPEDAQWQGVLDDLYQS